MCLFVFLSRENISPVRLRMLSGSRQAFAPLCRDVLPPAQERRARAAGTGAGRALASGCAQER